jgi:hypothetical protein
MPGRIDGQRALRQRGSSRRRIHLARADAAQDHVDPRDQLARAERLCHVIVAADLEFQHAIDLVVARGEKQDRHVGGLSDLAADFKPVKLGHADVEDDEVRPVGGKAGQALFAVARFGHGHAGLAQRHADDFADVQVVVDSKDAVGQFHLRSAIGRRLISMAVQPALQPPAPKTPASPRSNIRLQ